MAIESKNEKKWFFQQNLFKTVPGVQRGTIGGFPFTLRLVWFEKAIFRRTTIERLFTHLWDSRAYCVELCQNWIWGLLDWERHLCVFSPSFCHSKSANKQIQCVMFYAIEASSFLILFPTEVTHRSLACLFWMHFKEGKSGQVPVVRITLVCARHMSSAGLCFYACWCLKLLAYVHCKHYKQVVDSVVKWWK